MVRTCLEVCATVQTHSLTHTTHTHMWGRFGDTGAGYQKQAAGRARARAPRGPVTPLHAHRFHYAATVHVTRSAGLRGLCGLGLAGCCESAPSPSSAPPPPPITVGGAADDGGRGSLGAESRPEVRGGREWGACRGA